MLSISTPEPVGALAAAHLAAIERDPRGRPAIPPRPDGASAPGDLRARRGQVRPAAYPRGVWVECRVGPVEFPLVARAGRRRRCARLEGLNPAAPGAAQWRHLAPAQVVVRVSVGRAQPHVRRGSPRGHGRGAGTPRVRPGASSRPISSRASELRAPATARGRVRPRPRCAGSPPEVRRCRLSPMIRSTVVTWRKRRGGTRLEVDQLFPSS